MVQFFFDTRYDHRTHTAAYYTPKKRQNYLVCLCDVLCFKKSLHLKFFRIVGLTTKIGDQVLAA